MNRSWEACRRAFVALMCVLTALLLTGCMRSGESSETAVPEIPERLETNEDGVPVLRVYDSSLGKTEEMDVETYLMGVLAGEMKNTWPMEALKAQAILARTFTMKFVSSKSSVYEGADISTDIHEAQAYNAADVNDRVREAVNETRGIVMSSDGEFPHAWFHAHSGGKTELPSKALDYNSDPAYLSVVDSPDSPEAPEEVKAWTARFDPEEVQRACGEAGVKLGEITSFEIGKRGESGRAITFLVNGQEISAPTFRLRIGASKLKSTMIDSVQLENGEVVISGRGFGHGVGMSQWGAYAMAEEGKTAEEIINHYYTDVEFLELW